MQTYLVVDKGRENQVIRFIGDTFVESFTYIEQQINTGDYLICVHRAGERAPQVLACIERKTLADFASSFADGRYENRHKMIALRRDTGCQLYYFVEGPAFPNPNRSFGKKARAVRFHNILEAQTKLMIRDGIYVVLTENPAHTAQRLHDFVRVFANLLDGPEDPYLLPESKHYSEKVEGGAGLLLSSSSPMVPAIVTGRIEKSMELAVAEMWARLRGVSVALGRILAETLSVAQLVRGEFSHSQIGELKTTTGRTINKDAKASLRGLLRGEYSLEVKILSGVPGISPAIAKQILTTPRDLSSLLIQDCKSIAAIELQQKSRRIQLGESRAQRILDYMVFMIADAPPGDASPPDAPRKDVPLPEAPPGAAPGAAPGADPGSTSSIASSNPPVAPPKTTNAGESSGVDALLDELL